MRPQRLARYTDKIEFIAYAMQGSGMRCFIRENEKQNEYKKPCETEV